MESFKAVSRIKQKSGERLKMQDALLYYANPLSAYFCEDRWEDKGEKKPCGV